MKQIPAMGGVGNKFLKLSNIQNHLTLQDAGYQNMSRFYRKMDIWDILKKYFSFVKTIEIEEISYDVGILAGMYGGTQKKKRSRHVQGMKALKATGGNFAFAYPSQKILLEAKRPDGAVDIANVSVIAIVSYLIMKTVAMRRGKAKDAYEQV